MYVQRLATRDLEQLLTSIKTLESDHYVCVRQDNPANPTNPDVIIIDLKNNNDVIKRPIKADSAIMHWSRQVIALKAQSRTLQIFDLAQKQKLKSTTMTEDVAYWKWISQDTLGLVTEGSIYHWNVYDTNQSAPTKAFDKNANLSVGALRRFRRLTNDDVARDVKSSTTD